MMSIRDVNIKSLHLTLPQGTRRDAESLARSVASGLHEALQAGNAASGDMRDMRALRVTLPREHASANDITRAIAKALRTAREDR